jgi:RimK family alpha-L-glutamate ligase
MKKILFVNGGVKEFGNRFRAGCEKNNIECLSVRGHHNSVLVLETGSCRYFHLGEEVDLKDIDYSFIRVKTKRSHMTSLLSYIFKFYKIPFNDLGNLEHTKGDEKITQMVKFAVNNIPIPKTIVFSKISYKKNKEVIQQEISYPCVLKTNGSKGDAVWKINNQEDLENKMKEIDEDLMFIQEFVENHYDIRALIFDGEVLGAIERRSNDGFYNNVGKGGTAAETQISDEEKDLSVKAMEVLGLNFGGVDFIRTDAGIIFFEVNKGPQVYGLEEATGLDIPAMIVDEIKKKYLEK